MDSLGTANRLTEVMADKMGRGKVGRETEGFSELALEGRAVGASERV